MLLSGDALQLNCLQLAPRYCLSLDPPLGHLLLCIPQVSGCFSAKPRVCIWGDQHVQVRNNQGFLDLNLPHTETAVDAS